jgi:hypothetical protein
MTPRLHVIGQSNCVYRDGFGRKLLDDPRIKIEKILAIGSSASLLSNYFMRDVSASSAEYCLMDLLVYDLFLFYKGIYNETNLMACLHSAIVQARLRNIEPIFVLLPSAWQFEENLLKSERLLPVRSALYIHKRIPLERGCCYFDGLNWLQSTSRQDGIRPEEAFRDASHLNPEYSEKLARDIATAIIRLPPSAPTIFEETPFREIEPVDLAPSARPELVHTLSSSAVSLQLVQVDHSNPLSVYVGPCARVSGVIVDAIRGKGELMVSGRGTARSINLEADLGKLTFVARVVPLADDVSDIDGKVYLTTGPDDVIFASHLLVERETRTVTVPRSVSRNDLDLVALLQKTDQMP